eukprot:gene13562-13688_t
MKIKLVSGLFKHAASGVVHEATGIARPSTSHSRPSSQQGRPQQIKLRSEGPGPKTLADIQFHRCNIAICGASQAGKTALINSLLGVADGAPGSAILKRTDNGLYEYCLPGDPSMPVSLWEVPALKPEPTAPAAYGNILFAFSALLVLTPDTLKSHDVEVIRAALADNKPVVVVRSKADLSVQNLMRQHGCDAASAFKRLRQAFEQNLVMELGQQAAGQVQAFVISTEAFAANCAAAGHSSPVQQHIFTGFDDAHLQQWVNKAAQQAKIQALPCPGGSAADRAALPMQQRASHALQAQPGGAEAGHAASTGVELLPRSAPAGVRHSCPELRRERFNIAVCGALKAGKSSLINSLVGGPVEAAGFGVAGHTNCCKEFCMSHLPVSLWEVPALKPEPTAPAVYGSILFAFSALLVLTPDTLKSHDVEVIRAALADNKPVAVVRSKADLSVQNLMRQHGCDAASAFKRLRQAFEQNLVMELGQQAAGQVQAFVISTEAFAANCAAAGHSSPVQQHIFTGFDDAHLQQWVNKAAQQAKTQALPCPGGSAADRAALPMQQRASHALQAQPVGAEAGHAVSTGVELLPRSAPAGVSNSPDLGPAAASCGQAAANNLVMPSCVQAKQVSEVFPFESRNVLHQGQ